MTPNKMTAEDKRWRASSDAETMARYEEIMADPERKRLAVSAAKSMAADMNKRAAAMNRVAGDKAKNNKTTTKTKKK